jgi:phosphatidate cytidylyltransferase
VALPPLLALIVFGPPWSIVVLDAVCTAWGLYEVGAMLSAGTVVCVVLLAVAGVVPAVVGFAQCAPELSLALAVVAVAAMCGLIIQLNLGPARSTLPRALLVIIGGLYVGALYPYFALLRNRPGGVALLILVFATVMAGDSGAYFVGRAIGRIRLMPAISPGKTVEGAVAYVACSIAAAFVLAGPLGIRWGVGTTIAFGTLVGIIAQVGDLAESALKRLAGVKDSGWLFPGHGGLLDRTDSLVFAAVFAYYYGQWLGFAAA